MLKFRICQNCGSKVESPTSFFCVVCGQRLGTDNEASSDRKLPAQKIKFNRRYQLPAGVIILLVFLIALAVFYYRGVISNQNGQKPAPLLLESFNFDAPNEALAKPFFGEAIPEGVDFYLFGLKPAPLFEKILEADSRSSLEKTTGLSLPETASYLEPGFAFFGEGGRFAFLGTVRAVSFVEKKVKEINENPNPSSFRPYLFGPLLLVTDSEKLAGEVREALEKKRLNLSLKASFAESWRRSIHHGQYFVYVAGKSLWPETLALLFGQKHGAALAGRIAGQALLIFAAAEGTGLRGGFYGE